MKAHTASLLNALVLIALSAWAYASSETGSLTILVPAAVGVALLACYPGVKAENKIVAHIAVALTLLILLALFMPLMNAISRGDPMAITRVLIMVVATAIAFVFFIKSFIDARRSRA